MVLVNSKFSMRFGGVELMQWIDGVKNIDRNIGQNRTASLLKVAHTNGELFQYTTASRGTITVTALIFTDIHRRKLAQALMSDKPQQLIFGDEPDKYYQAIVDGQSTVAEAYYNNILTLTFIVPDGLAHAVDSKEVSGTSDADVVVDNMGSAPTAPILTATMHGDNGLVAFANDQGGVLQFGSSSEIDGVQHDDSKVTNAYSFIATPAGVTLNAGVINYPNYLGNSATPNKQIGTFDYTKNKDAATPVYNRVKTDYWAGPSMYGPIPANALGVNTGNFIWKNRLNVATSVKAAGRAEFTLSSGKTVAVSAVLRDSLYTADTLTFDCVYQATLLASVTLNRKLFTNGFYEIEIARLGNQVTFQLAKIQTLNSSGVHYSNALVKKVFTMAGFSNLAIDGLTGWFPGFSNTTGWTVNWSDSRFTWVNVDFWQDLPNRFSKGDVVTADVATKTILVNGVPDLSLHTVGNTWDKFMLQPGENTIQTIQSSWATTPLDVSIQFREAYY